MAEVAIDAETVAAFARDGAVHLPGVFADWVDTLRQAVAENLSSPGPLTRVHRDDGEQAAFISDYCNWARIEGFRRFVETSPAGAVAARLTGSRQVRIFHEHVLVKEPGASRPTPWHQDLPYYCVDGEQTCSLWVALDAVARERAVEFIAGSHRSGVIYAPTMFDGKRLNDNPRWHDVSEIDDMRRRGRILGWACRPGDAVAFSFKTLHGAAGNHSTMRRRAVSFRFVGDDVRFARRDGPTSPPFADVALNHGDELEAPEFPVVYGAEDRG